MKKWAYLREWRRRRSEVYIPLVHRAGDEAQVDFFEVTVEVAGQRRKPSRQGVKILGGALLPDGFDKRLVGQGYRYSPLRRGAQPRLGPIGSSGQRLLQRGSAVIS